MLCLRLGTLLRSAAAALVAVTLIPACARPSSTEEFVKLSGRSDDGLYRFELDMSDSLSAYDVSFYSRIDCNSVRLVSFRDFPMVITWISPDGVRKYHEKVYFPIHEETVGSSFYSKQYLIPYRSGLVPVRHGVWHLSVEVEADDHIPGFRGLGVICEKKSL